jgi:hypothetical protein
VTTAAGGRVGIQLRGRGRAGDTCGILGLQPLQKTFSSTPISLSYKSNYSHSC